MHYSISANSSSFLDRIFPSPVFLRMVASGVDISDTAIRFIDFGLKNGEVFIKSYGKRLLPAGAVSGGYINNSDAVIKILSDIKKETGISFANASLPDGLSDFPKARVSRSWLYPVRLLWQG